MARKAQPVRAVILPRTIGALGNDDEHHVDPRLSGLTVAWIPGDHGITMMLGGFTQNGTQQAPALTLFIAAQSVARIVRRGFPTGGDVLMASLGKVSIDKVVSDNTYVKGPPFEWIEWYNPESDDELVGIGYYSGAAHCIILAKNDPLNQPETLTIYHTGIIRKSGKPSKQKDSEPFFQVNGRIATWKLDEDHVSDDFKPEVDRKFMLELSLPERIYVFLTEDEVEDLLIVLRYKPDWLT